MPATATDKTVRAAIKSGQVDPVYVLVGDDEASKKSLVDAFETLVADEDRAFNVQQFYAGDVELVDVVSALRTLPFLGGRRVVFLMRAEALFKKRKSQQEGEDAPPVADDGEQPASGPLEAYLDRPERSNCLVVVGTEIDRSTKLGKQLAKTATVVEFWGLRTTKDGRGDDPEAIMERAGRYLESRLRDAGLSISADAAERIVQHAGADIATLRGDVERVIAYCSGRTRIDVEDVTAVVSGTAVMDDWALTNAIEARDLPAALRHLARALDSGVSPYPILGQLGWFVRAKMSRFAPSRIGELVDAVYDTDFALKSSGGDPQVLLERLVVRLCGGTGQRAGSARPLRGR